MLLRAYKNCKIKCILVIFIVIFCILNLFDCRPTKLFYLTKSSQVMTCFANPIKKDRYYLIVRTFAPIICCFFLLNSDNRKTSSGKKVNKVTIKFRRTNLGKIMIIMRLQCKTVAKNIYRTKLDSLILTYFITFATQYSME